MGRLPFPNPLPSHFHPWRVSGTPLDELYVSAVTLAESGNMLMMRGRAWDQGGWIKDAKLLVDAGNSAYKAAQAKDGNALAGLAGAVDDSCTTCHKQYRPNVFPKDGGSK